MRKPKQSKVIIIIKIISIITIIIKRIIITTIIKVYLFDRTK